MVFYAYVYHDIPGYAGAHTIWRWIVAAPSGDVMDEWWRTVSTSTKPEATTLGLKRLSPEFYTTAAIPDRPMFAAPEFRNKLVFAITSDEYDNNRSFPVIAEQHWADRISGNAFFIRSKSKPDLYWYSNNTTVYASTVTRTRFRIRMDNHADNTADKENTVMINKDRVFITLASNPNLALGISKGHLAVGDGADFFLGDLKDRFMAEGDNFQGMQIKQVEFGVGEEWELVH